MLRRGRRRQAPGILQGFMTNSRVKKNPFALMYRRAKVCVPGDAADAHASIPQHERFYTAVLPVQVLLFSLTGNFPPCKRVRPRKFRLRSFDYAGRCAFMNECICRTASGILSTGSFHGNMLTSALGASMAASIAITYGCGGESSGMMSRLSASRTARLNVSGAQAVPAARGSGRAGRHWVSPAAARNCPRGRRPASTRRVFPPVAPRSPRHRRPARE